MHRSLVPVLIAATGVLALPQSTGLDSLSTCAQASFLQNVGATGCPATDTQCLCTSGAFEKGLDTIRTACGPDDVAAAEAFGKSTCASAGVPVASNPSNTNTNTDLSTSSTAPTSGDGYTNSGSDTDIDATASTEGNAAAAAAAASGNDVNITNPGNGTVWVNGTCHACQGGSGSGSNGTAPPPSSPTNNGNGNANTGGSGGPTFTGAGNGLRVVGSAVMGLVVAGVGAVALL